MKTKLVIASFFIFMLIISGCSAQADPAQSVQDYLTALTSQDSDGAVAKSCGAWEEQARLEVDSFLSVEATLNAVECKATSQTETDAEVQCTGSIDMTYNEEIRSIDLSLRSYLLKFEAGEWRVCGYK